MSPVRKTRLAVMVSGTQTTVIGDEGSTDYVLRHAYIFRARKRTGWARNSDQTLGRLR